MSNPPVVAILLQWRERMRADGRDVPTATDLAAIAKSTGEWPAGIDLESAEPWRDTIEWLRRQARMGVTDPVRELPSTLLVPNASANAVARPAAAPRPTAAVPPPPPPPPADAAANSRAGDAAAPPHASAPSAGAPSAAPEPLREQGQSAPIATRKATAAFDALKTWVSEGMARDEKAFSELKDFRLRQIVNSGLRDADAIANVIPPAARPYAAELAAILILVGGSPKAPVEPSGETPSTPSTPQLPPSPVADRSAHPSPAPTLGSAAPPGTASLDLARPKPGAQFAVDPGAFAEFDFSEPVGDPGTLKRAGGKADAVSYTWGPPAEAARVVVYRVVSSDEFQPYAPDRADLVAITTEQSAVDSRPFTAAVRYVQVWRNDGDDLAAALAAQPTLHASAAFVSPVFDVDIREDSGRIIGQWGVFPGIRRVRVYRTPIELAGRSSGSPEYQILASEQNLGGFVDAPTPGRRYLYQAFAEVEIDGVVRLSSPRSVDKYVPPVLDNVTDIDVGQHGTEDDPQFDLTWTSPPAGRVVVFRTRNGPRAGADAEPRPESVLPTMGLDQADRLAYPITAAGDGRVSMRNVPWPRGWTRTYFTPVTILDGTASVGRTMSATLVPPVGEPVIVERVHKQYATFRWPSGADAVRAYIGPRNQLADQARGSHAHDISAHQYRELGSLALPPLPVGGCSVHLVPVAFADGEPIEGDAATVTYPGLLRLSYKVAMRRSLTGRPTVLSIAIWSEVPLPGTAPFAGPPPFVLLHNHERLPLDTSDGAPLEVYLDGDETLARTRRILPSRLAPNDEPPVWKAEVKDRNGGWVRLLVDLPPEVLGHVALIDPPVRQLRLDPLFGGR